MSTADREPAASRWRLPRTAPPLLRALAALRPAPGRVVLAVVTGTLALGCAVGLMATSAWLISRAAEHPPVIELSVAVVATRAFGIGRGALRYAERLVSHDVALRGVVAIRVRLYQRLVDADPAVVAGLRRGDLLARVGADVDALADVVVRSVLPFAVAALTGTVAATLLALALPVAGPVMVVGLVVAGVAAPLLAATAARRSELDAAGARSATSAEALALVESLAELTVAGAVPDRLRRLESLDHRLAPRWAAAPAALGAGLATLATGAVSLVCLVTGAVAVAAGDLAPVMLAVVVLAPVAVAEAVVPLPAAAVGLVRAHAAAVRVMDLLDAAPAAHAPEDSLGTVPDTGSADTGSARTTSPGGTSRSATGLRAEGLYCGWPGGPPVLRGIDLDVSPGRRVAVVGPSGAGKTTLLLTLAGLLPPLSGRVTLDGIPLHLLDPSALRTTVNLTAEDAHVFGTTVRQNLLLAGPGLRDPELLAALARAGLGPWLSELPRGLDTVLGSGGTDLSGGERRRLLLARALLVHAEVLLLDEPAEHLDPVTADTLLRDVLTAGPAVVVVTHRVSPLVATDEVLLIEDGAVGCRGRHHELLRTSARYRESWQVEQGACHGSRHAPASRRSRAPAR